MKKIIRLTESDLTRIVKRVINERSTSSQSPINQTPINEYGKNVEKALGKNFQLTAHQTDYSHTPINGSLNSYFLQSFDYGSKWGNDGIDLSFKATMFDDKRKLVPCQVSFVVILKNKLPIRIENGDVIYNDESHSLHLNDLNSKILPKIKNIKYIDEQGRSTLKCFKGMEYHGKNSASSYFPAGTEFFEKDNGDGTYDVYAKPKKGTWESGSGKIHSEFPEKLPKKHYFNWTCSNGVLTKQYLNLNYN